MTRKRHTAQEIVAKLRQVDVLTGQGRPVPETLPKPDDPRIVLKALPPSRLAVLRFSGVARQQDVERKTAELLGLTAARHLRAVSPPSLAQYNPPWTLQFMRRNEVMLPIEARESS